jgi:U3 small nucleolar RNA-associated protein 12
MIGSGQRHAVIGALGDPQLPGEYYVLKVVQKIRLSDLDDALLVLPYNHVMDLLACVSFWLEKVNLYMM